MIDVDAHHGNGTQEIFYDDPGVSPGPSTSTRAPAGSPTSWVRRRARSRRGPAPTATCRWRRGPATPWLDAIGELAGWARDGGAAAWWWRWASTPPPATRRAPGGHADGYREAGRMLGALGLPTVLVQEGGYDLEPIGELVAETLAGIEEGLGG